MKLYIPIYIALGLLLDGCTAEDWDTAFEVLDILAAPIEPTSQEACEAKSAAWVDGQCWASKTIADCENGGGRWMEGECRVSIKAD